MDLAKVGKLIRALRREKGLTQRALAEQLSVSDRTVSKWETGVSHSKRYYINYNNAALILYLL